MKQPLNLTRLRLMVDDPSGDDEMFTDGEYITMYENHDSIFCLAAEIWLLKAGELQSASSGAVAKYKVGDESYDMTELGDLHKHAMDMHYTYKNLCMDALDEMQPKQENYSVWAYVKRPDVL